MYKSLFILTPRFVCKRSLWKFTEFGMFVIAKCHFNLELRNHTFNLLPIDCIPAPSLPSTNAPII